MTLAFSSKARILSVSTAKYTGSAGKVTNCQVAVSLAVATTSEQIPIDFELYLPEAWANDPELRAEARVPADVVFKTKIELAIDMIVRASAAHIPGDVVLADSAYGSSSEFRAALRVMDFDFALGVTPQLGVSQMNNSGRCGLSVTAIELVQQLRPSAFRKEHPRPRSDRRLARRRGDILVPDLAGWRRERMDGHPSVG